MTDIITLTPEEQFRRSFLGKEIKCLDHGFVRVVDVMGNDAAVVQAARTSYGAGTTTKREDKGLINYLLRHKHTTPFEMCEVKFHAMMPIFIARQWVRHRTANINEYSMRYSKPKDVFYLPKPEALAPQSKTNKQGRAVEGYSGETSEHIINTIQDASRNSFDVYEDLANDNEAEEYNGLARELSRMVLPLNAYTEWYWKIDVHNLLHFLRLRMDAHAQYEIRVYANAMAELVKEWMPDTWEAFEEYILNSVTFSRRERALLANLVGSITHTETPEGFSAGEYREFCDKINKLKA